MKSLSDFLTQEEIAAPMPAAGWQSYDRQPFAGLHDWTVEKATMEEYVAFRPKDGTDARQIFDEANPDVAPGVRLRLVLVVSDDTDHAGRKVWHDIVLAPSSNEAEWALPKGKTDMHGLMKRAGLSYMPAVAEDLVGVSFTANASIYLGKDKKPKQRVDLSMSAKETKQGVMVPAQQARPANAPRHDDEGVF